ncbi:MAG TPA: hypothetical protein VJX29_06435, partial [Candidatus Acidoferrales bacterium]|nr:hypothetical protein [Candidatus Acidoferrales bacterium]
DSSGVEARALAIVGQLWLNGGIYAHKRLLSRQMVEQFTAHRREKNEVFTAGWEVSQAPGHSFSPGSYGWTDESWGSLWVDPEREVFVVSLVRGPGMWEEHGPKIASPGPLRAEVYDAIFAALGLNQTR